MQKARSLADLKTNKGAAIFWLMCAAIDLEINGSDSTFNDAWLYAREAVEEMRANRREKS